jgi:hypothetical protein
VNDSSVSSEENISLLESYKVRQAIPDGDKVVINVFCRDPFTISMLVEPNLSSSLLDECTTITSDWVVQEIHPHQIKLARWVLSKALSPRDLDDIGHESLLRCIGATQAILYHWGYKALAALMTARASMDPTVAPMASLWARDALDKATIRRLSEEFPHYRASGKKDQTVDDLNPGIVGVNELAQDIYQYDWVLTRPEWLASEIQISDVGTILTPPGLKQQLAEVLLRSVSSAPVDQSSSF